MCSKEIQVQIFDLKNHPEHIPQLAEWHHKEWARLNPGLGLQDRIEKMQAYIDDAFIPGMFIAKYEGQLVGSAAIVKHDMETNRELFPWLASVYVVPEVRQKGVGSKLIRYVMAQAREAGIETLYLFTPNKENFYKKFNWTALSKESYHGERVTVMKIELNT